jgi:hypothetical protein
VALQAQENMGDKMKENNKSSGRKIMSNIINFCNEETEVRESSPNRTYKRIEGTRL